MKCKICHFNNSPIARFCARCGAKLDLFETPTENIRSSIRDIENNSLLFDRYEVKEIIGSGGMGTVYRVLDRKIDEIVALKIIRPEIATNRDVIERFKQELKTARRITHKHVSRMFDIGEFDGVNYITMEYVSGEDLRSLIRRIGQLPVSKTIDIAMQICEGLSEAHSMGVVHRDLKPQNIMIDRDGITKIMDFGIARFIKTENITMTGTIVGTPEYMSPEQAESKSVDQRSDIYSLGILIFEALTGKTPFAGDTPLSIAIKHKTEPPTDPRRLNGQIPAALNNLILRCLEKEKEKRYQTVHELITDLGRIAKTIPACQFGISDQKPSMAREIEYKFRRKRILITSGIVLVLAGLAIGVRFLWLKPKPFYSINQTPESHLSEDNQEMAEEIYPEALNRFKQQYLLRAPHDRETEGLRRIADSLAARQKPPENRIDRTNEEPIEDHIRTGLIAAQKACDSGNYKECLKLSLDVLNNAPQNVLARDYVRLASEKLAEVEIKSLVDQYILSFINNNPVEFYKMHCTPQLFEEIRDEAELISGLFDNFKPTASSVNIRWTETNKLEATFHNWLLGTSKETGADQELSNGTMHWNLEKQGSSWKIAKIDYQQFN